MEQRNELSLIEAYFTNLVPSADSLNADANLFTWRCSCSTAKLLRVGSCELRLSAVRVNNMPGGLAWKSCFNRNEDKMQLIWKHA